MIFRRRILISTRHTPGAGGAGGAGEARAALEDDFHHFRVRMAHEGGRVRHIQGWGVRHPYTTCPLAAGELSRLVDMRLGPIATSVARITDPREQCTHLMDLAGLAIAAAARSIVSRRYDISVPRRSDGYTCATLDRDGIPLLAWELQDTTIMEPAPYQSISLREGMASWAFAMLDLEEAEAALVLRRCALISLGRTKNLDTQVHAEPTGRCFVQQPQRAALGRRMVGSTLDFSDRVAALCATDLDWLAFASDAA